MDMIKPSVETTFEDISTISDNTLNVTNIITPICKFNPSIRFIHTKFGSYIVEGWKCKNTYHGFRCKQIERHIERRYKNLPDYLDFVFGKTKEYEYKNKIEKELYIKNNVIVMKKDSR